MPAHLLIPLLAIGCLALVGAAVAVIQPRVRWLRWTGAAVLLAAGAGLVAVRHLPGAA